jgi:AraC-like DNA-binding protein
MLQYINDIPTKLGHIISLGLIKNGTGTERGVLRVYGSYALVYFLEGTGDYYDANGYQHKIVPGDLVLVTPELPHCYSTKPGRYWTEYHLIFEGPIFDFCQTHGILNPAQPIIHLDPIDLWQARLQSIIRTPSSQSLIEKAAEISRLLALLMEIYVGESNTLAESGAMAWLAEAKAMLDVDLEIKIAPKTVARNLDMSYETFRKGFQKQFGVSPGLYRTQRRISVARRLLKLTTMTQQQIAEHLGFSDEFHFSKRFKQIEGVTPREYRRQPDQ